MQTRARSIGLAVLLFVTVVTAGTVAVLRLTSRPQSGKSPATAGTATNAQNRETAGGEEQAEPQAETLENTNRVIADFGDYEVHLHRSISQMGDAQSEVANWYEVLRKYTKKAVKDTDLFPEPLVVAAVTGAIQDDVYGSDPDTADEFKRLRAATSAAALKASLAKLGASLLVKAEECEETVPPEIITGDFAVIGYDPATHLAAVHLALPFTSHICQSSWPRLRLQIPAPATLQPALEAAAARQQGFFAPAEALKVCENCLPVDITAVELEGP